jgi:hypothetical protein
MKAKYDEMDAMLIAKINSRITVDELMELRMDIGLRYLDLREQDGWISSAEATLMRKSKYFWDWWREAIYRKDCKMINTYDSFELEQYEHWIWMAQNTLYVNTILESKIKKQCISG